jgi:hypothetical protein
MKLTPFRAMFGIEANVLRRLPPFPVMVPRAIYGFEVWSYRYEEHMIEWLEDWMHDK